MTQILHPPFQVSSGAPGAGVRWVM